MLRALHRVRSELAGGADPASAPDVPPGVAARISEALAAAPRAHFARPRARRGRTVATVAGLCAALAAVTVGTVALLRTPAPAAGPPLAQHITAARPNAGTASTTGGAIPLTPAEIWGLLGHAPGYGGVLGDPARRASCLGGLGYPASTPILGARPIQINAHPVVLLVVAGDSADALEAFAVAPACNAADTGLVASTRVPRP